MKIKKITPHQMSRARRSSQSRATLAEILAAVRTMSELILSSSTPWVFQVSLLWIAHSNLQSEARLTRGCGAHKSLTGASQVPQNVTSRSKKTLLLIS